MFDINSKEYQTYLQLIKSNETKTTYTYQLRLFQKWIETKYPRISSWHMFIVLPHNEIDQIFMDYLLVLKNKNLKYSSILTAFASVEFLLDIHNVNYNKKHVHRYFPTKNKPKGEQAYSLNDIQAMLKVTKSTRDKALLLVLATSGIRSGAVGLLKCGHVQDIENCKKLIIYGGDNEEYVTFITPEAAKALDEYLQEREENGEKLDDSSPLFRKASLSHKLYDYRTVGAITRASVWAIITRLVKTAKVIDNV
jgi:integrase